MRNTFFIVVLLGGMVLGGCRGSISEEPPVHLNQNMDFMERYDPQEASPFFADGRTMRPPVPGTVARGMLKDDTRFYLGREADGALVEEIPVPITRAFALRGRDRYNIYCAVCHGKAGDGEGIVMTGGYGFARIGFHNDRLRQSVNGYFFDVITNGIRTMPAYGQQIPVADRWAITAYLRVLQRSQNASESDVPFDVLEGLPTAGTPTAVPATTAVVPDSDTPPDGPAVFAKYLCNTCHSLDGSVGAGPTLQGIGSRQTREQITESLRNPDAVIVEGFVAGVMGASLDAFGFGSVTDAEFDALVDYLLAQQ